MSLAAHITHETPLNNNCDLPQNLLKGARRAGSERRWFDAVDAFERVLLTQPEMTWVELEALNALGKSIPERISEGSELGGVFFPYYKRNRYQDSLYRTLSSKHVPFAPLDSWSLRNLLVRQVMEKRRMIFHQHWLSP